LIASELPQDWINMSKQPIILLLLLFSAVEDVKRRDEHVTTTHHHLRGTLQYSDWNANRVRGSFDGQIWNCRQGRLLPFEGLPAMCIGRTFEL
jgi:hypothetical protein